MRRVVAVSLLAASFLLVPAAPSYAWSHGGRGGHGITQVYEKSGEPLEVRLIEGWWFTFVELTAIRAEPHATK